MPKIILDQAKNHSKKKANTRLTNGYCLYDWVMRKSCYPSFWGRTLCGEGVLESEEIEYLKSQKCKIALIIRDLNEADISANKAEKDALRAVEAAKKLEVPQNMGIALFAEIDRNWSVNHNWMLSFAYHLTKNGYIPGFIGNTDSSDNFNFGRQCSHYVQAMRSRTEYPSVYWSSAPKYNFDPESWAPYAPSELLPKDMHLWQYGTVNFHSIQVNKSYARDESIMKNFWTV